MLREAMSVHTVETNDGCSAVPAAGSKKTRIHSYFLRYIKTRAKMASTERRAVDVQSLRSGINQLLLVADMTGLPCRAAEQVLVDGQVTISQ